MLHARRRKSLQNAFHANDSTLLAQLWLECKLADQNPWQAVDEPLEDDWRDELAQGLLSLQARRQGHVYVAAYLPAAEVHKIGQTAKKPADRIRGLRTAGVLAPLVLLHSVWTPDRHAVEAGAHHLLAAHRIDREFFQVGYEAAIATVGASSERTRRVWSTALQELGRELEIPA